MRAAFIASRNAGILGRFHRDLREEDHVARQLRELLHQLEALGAQPLQVLGAGPGRRAAPAILMSVSVTG